MAPAPKSACMPYRGGYRLFPTFQPPDPATVGAADGFDRNNGGFGGL